MQKLISAKNLTTILLVIVVVGIFLLWWQVNATRRIEFTNQLDQIVLKHPVKLSSFKLNDSNGPDFTNQSLQGRWAFLYFGYTDCQNACSDTMTTLSNVYDQLKAQSISVPLLLFVSIKPENDSTAKIKNYVTNFNPNFLGLTMKEPNLTQFVQEFSKPLAELKSSDKNQIISGEKLASMGSIFLIDPTGKLSGIFSMPYSVDSMIKNYKAIIDQSKKLS